MSIENLVNDRKDDLLACKSPQELLALLQEEGIQLTDEQMDAVVGGLGGDWSLEGFADMLANAFAGILPEGYDIKSIWGNLPTGGMH
ncbi:MAG: hypothetical protein IJI88_04400 [Atopobiaceae bacterium]|nr:hypothetical protein [Olsenella sp.]MBQ6491495.1 hypothetical protein [Atopobiaceae bacterium]